MNIPWGSKKWELLVALLVVFLLAYGAIVTVMDIMIGHPLWWYDLSLVVFGLSSIGLLLLIREGKVTLDNISKFGIHPDCDKYTKTRMDVQAQTEG